ncbi:MAG: inositol-3-phosphate synthase, partial [Acidobacteria bacterium]|nr:inositol-3-phosphate synthase [Acidobacteriota bacterium]
VVGLGAVATTMIAGVEAVRRGLAKPIGSVTQMGTIRLGKRMDNNTPLIKDFVPLADLNDLVFTGWDIFEDNVYEAAAHAEVLDKSTLEKLKPYLEQITPLPAVFDQHYVKRLHGTHVKKGKNKRDLAEQVMADIRNFKKTVDRVVMIWCGSTEIFLEPSAVHESIAAFEKGLESNDPGIAPSQIYAYAALKEGVPFANGAPNLTVDTKALIELSKQNAAPICGKDFKTGQTLMKTVLAPAFKARLLGVNGWFSTNILGNRDGEVLDDPESFKSKETTKLGVLDYILQPEIYQSLYGKLFHKVRIEYYPPRGDAKEGWDNIDLFGWLGYPMQMKIDFLCRDSILAAPIVLDLALLLDFAQRAGWSGIQEWLSFYFKCPMTAPELYPEHDLFIQLMKLKNTMRWAMGEETLTHLGHEYY